MENKNQNQNQDQNKKSETPVLDSYSKDLTKAAREESLDPIVGRDEEIERMSQILARRKKNNPVLIGEPGVGKSAIVEGLAQRIQEKKVPRSLYDMRVLTIDMGSMVAGTKYRGQFEERIKALMKELEKEENIIIFIDELHTIVGAGGSQGSLDASNMLKPALARGEIQCIGATTLDEYRKNIEKDGALERRFQKVNVKPSTKEETKKILKNLKNRYEDHHNIKYTDDAIEACVDLTERYLTDKNLPDKAIDALDEAGSRIQNSYSIPQSVLDLENKIEEVKSEKMKSVEEQDFEKAANKRDEEKKLSEKLEEEKRKWDEQISKNRQFVDEATISRVVSLMSGVPVDSVQTSESERLSNLDGIIKNEVIGQDEAVNKVVKSIHRNRSGLKDPNRPIGSFIFLGPTGVGKTHLSKTLAKQLFDSEDSLIRMDMSEYSEKYSISRMTGAAPGYVGYEEGGQLTEKVRRNPYSIILLDEIEKAHDDVFNTLLQILDEGHMTDSNGRNVDFKNTIIIMTSNIGVKEIQEFGSGIGFKAGDDNYENKEENNKNMIQKSLNKRFKPEFLNRIDDIIIFQSLKDDELSKIVDLEVQSLIDRMKEHLGNSLEITQKAKDFIKEKTDVSKYGARPIKRTIQDYIEDPLSEKIIKREITKNDGLKVKVDYNKSKNEDSLNIKINKR